MKTYIKNFQAVIAKWLDSSDSDVARFFVRMNIAGWTGLTSGTLTAFWSIVFFPEQSDIIVLVTQVLVVITFTAVTYLSWKWSIWVNNIWKKKEPNK